MDFWSILYIKTWFHGLYSTENTTINNKTTITKLLKQVRKHNKVQQRGQAAETTLFHMLNHSLGFHMYTAEQLQAVSTAQVSFNMYTTTLARAYHGQQRNKKIAVLKFL